MASTAFVSEYFEKRPPGRGAGIDAGEPAPAFGTQETPPAIYRQGPSPKGRGSVIVSSVLRLLTFLFAVIAIVILVSSKGSFGLQINGITQVYTVKFTILRAFKYLFSACCIVAVYSLAMLIVSLVSLCVTSLAHSKGILWIVFICDQVLAYILISAGAAGANGVMVSKNDENLTGLTAGLSCEKVGLTNFCNKAAVSVGLALAAFLLLAVTAVLSSRRLFRH